MLITRHQLGERAALAMLDAARGRAQELGVAQNIAVVDPAGHLLAFCRMDGAKFHSIDTALAKAVTAASIGAPSGGAPADTGVLVGITTRGRFTNMVGGLPALVDGVTVGAVGVGSGTPEQDVAVAEAALAGLADLIGRAASPLRP